ncbi:MAG: hypothetical protein D6776_06630 [Planctomycetota bacterium]|nr:MAG: hypothetical protein D6776_06630 [Planctomycetota bacterium]
MTTEPTEPAPAPNPPEEPAGDLALDPDRACQLVSEHGGEIVILDDGRVVFMNASAHLIELAHAIAPEDEEIAERMRRLEEVRRQRAARDEHDAHASRGD